MARLENEGNKNNILRSGWFYALTHAIVLIALFRVWTIKEICN